MVTQLPTFQDILNYSVGMPKSKDSENNNDEKPKKGGQAKRRPKGNAKKDSNKKNK